MRGFTILASTALLATQAAALPSALARLTNWARATGNSNGINPVCMSDSDAQTVANNFQALIASYTVAEANAALTSGFTDYSDSVSELINGGCTNGPQKLGAPTFTSRANFEAGQGSQPPIPFKQLNVWHNCNTVTLRWVSAQTPQQVTGIIVLETQWSNFKWIINTVYSEFNSGAWLVNLGVFKPSNCTA